MARFLILAGLALVLFGLIWQFFPQLLPKLFGWFGKLPGDVDFEMGQTRVFIPITSMLAISFVLSILANIFKK